MAPQRRTFGPADRVTFARAVLVCAVAGLAMAVARLGSGGTAGLLVGPLVGLAAVALVLDGVDGLVARRTGTVSAFGARFDMEVDAVLILVLSLHVARELGAWVVAIGAARYLLFLAQRVWPWLCRGLPPSRWRKAVAAYQGIALTTASAHLLPVMGVAALVAVGLVALGLSFGTEARSLWRLRAPSSIAPVAPGLSSVLE